MGLLDALMGGASRGFTADTLGAPVDLSADAINALTASAGQLLPQGFPQITNPVGGSAWMAQKMRDVGMLSDQPGTAGDAIGGLIPMLMGPLKEDAPGLIQALLGRVASGEKPPLTQIGTLTADQFKALNDARASMGMPPFGTPDVLYRGTHHYKSRVLEQDPPNPPDELINQIQSAMSPDSTVVLGGRTPALQNPNKRADDLNKMVNDEAVFTQTSRGNPELYSVIPRNDGRKKVRP